MARHHQTDKLLKELRHVLDIIPTKSSEGTFEEGERYICSTCNLPLKLCELHGGSRCASMIRANTQLEILETSIHETLQQGKRTCLRCGGTIPGRLLQRNPSRELCSECSSTAHRKRRRKPSPGAST